MTYEPARKPTFYFIGVTTGQSSIMTVFPLWARHLGLGDVEMKGIDLALNDRPERYREVVSFLKQDPLSLGALVTTHKLDLFAAARDLFDETDPYADLMAETSCISKRDGRLICHAKDPISSGLAIGGFLPDRHFARTGAAVFSMGGGGAAIAITSHLMDPRRGDDRPSHIIVSDNSQDRLDHIRDIHARLKPDLAVEYVVVREAEDNDRLLNGLAPQSLVVNATGMGKDRPGSPLSGSGTFPAQGIAWDLNYRGDLVFLDQARSQSTPLDLRIEDGWTYFIHGWTRVIAEVFNIEIPVSGPGFDTISRIAAEATGRLPASGQIPAG